MAEQLKAAPMNVETRSRGAPIRGAGGVIALTAISEYLILGPGEIRMSHSGCVQYIPELCQELKRAIQKGAVNGN